MKIYKNSKVVASKSADKKQKIMAARDVQVLLFAELTPDQQEKAIALVDTDRELSELLYTWYNDDVMDQYHYEVNELVKEYESNYYLSINADKLYWQSNSQGSYPEWDLSRVFDDVRIDDPIEDTVIDIEFAGSSTTVDVYTDVLVDDVWETVDCDEYTLAEYGVSRESIAARMEIANAAQSFIDKVWEMIHDVCTSYPDEEWIRGMLEGNAIEFIVDGDNVYFT